MKKLIACLCLVCILVSCPIYGYAAKNDNGSLFTAPTIAQAPLSMNVGDLFKEINSDAKAAREKYNGQEVLILECMPYNADGNQVSFGFNIYSGYDMLTGTLSSEAEEYMNKNFILTTLSDEQLSKLSSLNDTTVTLHGVIEDAVSPDYPEICVTIITISDIIEDTGKSSASLNGEGSAGLPLTATKPDEATQIVIDEINRLQTVEVLTLDDIEKAKERYNSLTDSQKEKVPNYAVLLKLEDNFAELGKIHLTLDNYQEYLTVSYDQSFSLEKGKDEKGRKVFETMTIKALSLGKDEYKYEDVVIQIRVGGEYGPLSKLGSGKYGLRAGTPILEIDDTFSFFCDETGVGSGLVNIYAGDTKYGEGVFGTDSFLFGNVTLTITDISGTVLPKKQ